MGLWEPETCRVKIKEINTQNKELRPLVTLLQYVQKVHGVNNLKEEEVLRTVKEERLILRKIKKKKGDLIGHILRWDCLIKHVNP